MPKTALETTEKTAVRDRVLERGPLEDAFPCSRSKILDFLIVFDGYDYSISDIGRHCGLSFKTALREIRRMESDSLVTNTRTSGRALMYRLNPRSKEVESISKLARDIAIRRITESAKKPARG